MLFANNKFPLSVDPTELPEGVVEDVHFDPQEPEQLRGETAASSPYGFAGDGCDLPPGATAKTLSEQLGPLEEKLQPVEDKLKEGPGKTPTAIEFSPAKLLLRKWKRKSTTSLKNQAQAKVCVAAHLKCPFLAQAL